MKDLSLIEIIDKIKNKRVSQKEVWDYFISRIKKYDNKLNSFNFVNNSWFEEKNDSPLMWAPIWIKDIFCEIWVPTTCSSKMLSDFIPPYDATIIKKLKKAWMNSIWKLNMDEFAMWSTWESSFFGPTINPWGTNRIPWWSSSWSARAVAAWLCPAALWTDTGWSIRQPASMCNVVWFKPSYWRNSRYWVIAMASSLDCPWTFTKTVRDAWLLYDIMNWYDEKEDTSILKNEKIDPKIWDKKDLKWIKIWVPKEYFEEWLDEWVRKTINEAINILNNLWAEIKKISLPMTKYAVATYYILMPREVSTNLWRLDGIRYWYSSNKPYENINELYENNRWEWFWDEVQRRIILWSYVLSAWFYDAYYKKASQIRTLIIKDFEKAFNEVDVIVWPVSPSVAWKLWEKVNDPIKMYLSDAYTIPASLAWLPWISIPAWFAESNDKEKEMLPVWLQILAPLFQDQKVFEVAHVFEKNTDFHKQKPKWFE